MADTLTTGTAREREGGATEVMDAAEQEDQGITRQVEALLEAPIAGLGCRLLEVQYRQEGRWVLRLIVDGEGGVGLDHLAQISELASRLLDVEDPIAGEYALEVSSPGLFRPLSERRHFEQSIGKLAKLTLSSDCLPERKNKVLRGRIEALVEVDGQEAVRLTLQAKAQRKRAPAPEPEGPLTIPLDGIRTARLDPDL